MMKLVKASVVLAAAVVLSGCTGTVYNASKGCGYDYVLHPAISISRIIDGCGPATQK